MASSHGHKKVRAITPDEESLGALFGLDERQSERAMARADVLEFWAAAEQRMQAAGVSRAELAERLGVQRSQVSRWFSGDKSANATTLCHIARALGHKLAFEWRPLQMTRFEVVVSADTTAKPVSPARSFSEADGVRLQLAA